MNILGSSSLYNTHVPSGQKSVKQANMSFADLMDAQIEKNQKKDKFEDIPTKNHFTIEIRPDSIFFSGDGRGQQLYIKYADDSTAEDPTVIADGTDLYGNKFEMKIHINDIDPYNATYIEMAALGAHLKTPGYGLKPVARPSGEYSYTERQNFVQDFKSAISDYKKMNYVKGIERESNKLDMYLDFFYANKKS